jgi:hypothetical protein
MGSILKTKMKMMATKNKTTQFLSTACISKTRDRERNSSYSPVAREKTYQEILATKRKKNSMVVKTGKCGLRTTSWRSRS